MSTEAKPGASREGGYAGDSVVIILSEAAEQSGIRLILEEPLWQGLPALPEGYSSPSRILRVAVRRPEGYVAGQPDQLTATLEVLLSEDDLLKSDGDPYALTILRLEDDSSEWWPANTSLDLPWIRAEVNFDGSAQFALVAISPEETDRREIENPFAVNNLSVPTQFSPPPENATPSNTVPAPVSSPTETPRPRPYLVRVPATPTSTSRPTRPHNPLPSAAPHENQTVEPPAPSPVPAPSASPTSTILPTPKNTDTPTPSPTRLPRYRLFINGRQVLSSDARFLVPLGVVRLDTLPGPAGAYPDATVVNLEVEIDPLGGALAIYGADTVSGASARIRIDRERHVRVHVSLRETPGRGPQVDTPTLTPTSTPTRTPTPTPTPSRTPTPTSAPTQPTPAPRAAAYARAHRDAYAISYANTHAHAYPHPYAYLNANTDFLADTNGYTDANTRADRDAYAIPNANTDFLADTDAHCDVGAHTHANAIPASRRWTRRL